MTTVTTPATSNPAVVPPMARRVKTSLSSRAASVLALAIALFWTVPTFGLLLSSFRPENEIKTSGWWTFFTNPNLTLKNYNDVLFGATGNLGNFFLNTFVITVPSVLFSILLGSAAAYALSWMEWKGRDWVFILVFAAQVVPLQLALIPMLKIFSTLPPFSTMDPQGLTKFVNIWIAHVAFGMPLVTFLLHNFMSSLPREVMESARVDGCDHARLYRSIVLPLIVPALAAVGIFQFLYIWNDLLVGLVFGTPQTSPLTKALAELAGTRGGEWQRLTSGAFVGMVVPLIVFFSLQRYFVRGLLAGSVKG
jgi:alpha-glucoside transport system permease protein